MNTKSKKRLKQEEEIEIDIPIIRDIIAWGKGIVLPGLNGLTLYGFLDIYINGLIKGTFSSRASSIAYSFFIAIFPFLLLLLNLIPFVPIQNFQQKFLIFIEGLLPPQTTDFFYPVIADIVANPRGGLLSFALLLAIILSANGVNAIFSAFEYSVHVTINRSFVRQYLVSIGVALLLALLLLTTVGAIFYAEYFLKNLSGRAYIKDDSFYISLSQLIIFVGMLYVLIATLYYFGTKEGKKSRFFSLGAFITTILFLLTTYLFGIYINNFSNYNELYGSIGALLIMLFYIWINANLLLLGFELNISLQRMRIKKEK